LGEICYEKFDGGKKDLTGNFRRKIFVEFVFAEKRRTPGEGGRPV